MIQFFPCSALVALVLTCLASPAVAQQALFTDAATQPSEGVLLLRQLARVDLFDGAGDDTVTDATYTASLFYGLSEDVSLSVQVPLRHRSGDGRFDDAFGFDDIHLMAKWRPWQNDFGPLDTARFALFGGASVPVGDNAYTSDSLDPMVGGVFTLITGRHGFNAAAQWRFNSGDTGDDLSLRFGNGPFDSGRLDANYVYRLWPAAFTAANSGGGWYAFLEGNLEYETSGDAALFLAPGIMYEGSDIALEAGLRLPVASDVERRPEEELSLAVGVRIFL